MLFLHPFLLAGAGLIAVPIVLHLVMRRRPRRLEFPALRFVQQRHDSNRRRLRWQHLLLLLLRVLVIALLALALAGPSMRLPNSLGGNQEEPVAAALVFDAAPRMDYRQENRTRLDVARDIGRSLLGQLPRDSQIAVLDTRVGPAVFQPDRGSALQRIEQLATAGNSQPLIRSVIDGLQLLQQQVQTTRKELYIFTDLTRGAWPEGSSGRLQDEIAKVPGVGLYVIDVGADKPVNAWLGELRLSSQVVTDRMPLAVETDVGCVGSGGPRTIELYLEERGGPPQAKSRAACTLKPGAAEHVELSAGILNVGTHQGFVRIVGQDGLAADDKRYFTAEVKRAWRVLIAAPPPVAQKALSVRMALAPATWRSEGRSEYDCDVIALAELGQKKLADYAAVLVLDPPPLGELVWQKLAKFAGDGQGVAVFLGRNAQPLEAFNQPAAQEVLAGQLALQARRDADDNSLYLAPHNYEHPVLARFKPYASSIPWDGMPVHRYWQLKKLARGANVILSFNDEDPALIERPVGLGRAVTMTTPASDSEGRHRDPWNDFLIGEDNWPFSPLINQLAAYLVGSAEERFNYTAGQAAVLSLERFPTARPFLLTTPPPQELTVPLSSDPQHHNLTITATDRPGNYRVQGGGEAAGVDRGFSVNLAPEQTALERFAKEKLKEVFGPFDYRLARNKEQLDRVVTTGRVGRDLFPLVILLVALLLALEQVVGDRFYRDDPAAAQAAARSAALARVLAESGGAARPAAAPEPEPALSATPPPL